ncbi:MAG: type III-B CRISPR module RAMP protein Cmr6 [Desulfobacterales bacterium]
MSQQSKTMHDPENRFSPLPAYLENQRDKISNFGMFYQKFAKYHINAEKKALQIQHAWNNGKKGKERKSFEWSLIENQITHYHNIRNDASNALAARHRFQKKLLSSYKKICTEVVELQAFNISRVLTGIGEPTPTEVGMVFDRNTGLPFIPASSFKGVVRQAYCFNFVQNNAGQQVREEIDENEIPGLVDIFGSLDPKKARQGGFAFMDIYPEQVPDLSIDIMNPHFGKYYRSEGPPEETEEPVPIKFLAVEKDQKFIIRGFFLGNGAGAFYNELMAALQTAFCELGIGAKTAAGYGRFTMPTGSAESTAHEHETEKQTQKDEPEPIVWENAVLLYDKGKAELKASLGNATAFSTEKNIIPEDLYNKLTLKKKKKPVTANILVQPIGRSFRILNIIE